MSNKYLKKKTMRTLNKEESSITENIGSNANSPISLQKDKIENKESIPSNNKSEQSSSTISARGKDENLNSSSYIGKKDIRRFKRLTVKPNIEKVQNLDNFNEKFQLFQKQLDELKDQKKADDLKINNLEKKVDNLIKDNVNLKKDNVNLKKDNDNLKKDNELKICELRQKVKALDVQVKELDKYFFADKLRKLSKKLIEYIIKQFYFSSMKSMKYGSVKRIYFVKVPPNFPHLNCAKDTDIIDALNRMLELLFSKAKSNDLVIHFFDAKANQDDSLKKKYSVFKNKDEFFRYFNIIGKDKIIIDKIFPEDYLTIIDNTSEDISIKSLLNVVSEIKKNEKKI